MNEAKEETKEIPKTERAKAFDEIEKKIKRKPKPKDKRRVGRPTLDEQQAKEAEEKAELAAQMEVDTVAIRGMLEWIFGSLLAPRFGPHWGLKLDEAEAGAKAWGAVLAKYSPAATRFIEEIRAGMWTVGTVGPRWEKTKEIMAEQAARAAKEAAPPPLKDLTKEQEAHNVKVEKQ